MILNFDVLLMQNQVLGINTKNRLHCRKYGWFDLCVADAPWVFNNDNDSADNCADNCANNCANNAFSNVGWRSALFRAVGVWGELRTFFATAVKSLASLQGQSVRNNQNTFQI